MRRFNRRYTGRGYATDVLAFDTGDLVVCVPTARRQAREQKHSPRRELVHLATHGLLHLAGWRDDTAAERRAMEECTVRLLDRAGVF